MDLNKISNYAVLERNFGTLNIHIAEIFFFNTILYETITYTIIDGFSDELVFAPIVHQFIN